MTRENTPDFCLIENRGPDNLRDTVCHELRAGRRASLAVAFVTRAGLAQVIEPLQRVCSSGQVMFLTGLYQHCTEPATLSDLLKMQKRTKGAFQVRISKEPKFHKKLYIIENPKRLSLFIGSSNLTAEGMTNSGETNMRVETVCGSPLCKEIRAAFTKDWQRAVDLDSGIIQRYEEKRYPYQRKSQSGKTLEQILGVKLKGAEPGSRRFWRECIFTCASDETEQIVSKETDWDERQFLWFGSGGRHSYKNGDTLFLFDKVDKTLRQAQVMDTCRTKMPTTDGRHFVAFKYSTSRYKKLIPSLWKTLLHVDITRKNFSERKKLGNHAARVLFDLLKKG